MSVTGSARSEYDAIAGVYQKARPQYPPRLVARFSEFLPEGPLEAIDVGAGTGIATRAVARALGERLSITGIEPSEGMRTQALEATPEDAGITYRDGIAEHLPFADTTLDLVLSAQALHWFDRPGFYRDAGRVLKPGGMLACLNNNRDWRECAFAEGYEEILERHSPDYSRSYREFDVESELAALDWTSEVQSLQETWMRPMKPEAFMAMAESSSRTQDAMRAAGREVVERDLGELVDRHAESDGFVVLVYVCALAFALKST